jgi:LemA protein
MKIALIVIGVLVLMLLFTGGKYVSVRNDLVTKQEAVTAQWAQVESAMQRRADLIPNLVSTVKGFAAHETEVYKDIADARAPTISSIAPSPACWWWSRTTRS